MNHLAAPLVAGLVGYWRALDSPWKAQLNDPAKVKKLITAFHRPIESENVPVSSASKRMIWNGQVLKKNCLKDYSTKSSWDKEGACPNLATDLLNQPSGPSADDPFACVGGSGTTPAKRQDAGGSCPYDNAGSGVSITFSSSSVATPTCTAGGCGKLCTGFWCAPNPTDVPPDYQDPKDPNGGALVPTTTIGGSSSTTSAGPPPVATCDDKCKLDKGNACNCNENGCDADSPACCGDASCPPCTCNEDGCNADSPACCASNTCAWSWTGGGGGGSGGDGGPAPTTTSTGSSSQPTAAYDIWSYTFSTYNGGTSSSTSYELEGFQGLQKYPCDSPKPEWSSDTDTSGSTLLSSYKGIKVYGDSCDYKASVANYNGVDVGTKIGTLTCKKWAQATCFRGNYKANLDHYCGVGTLTEELYCTW